MLAVLMINVTVQSEESPNLADSPSERAVQDVMSLTEQQILSYIPEQCPEVAVASPEIGTHMREARKAWQWDWRRPNQVRCPASGLAFPNDTYLMNKKAVYWNYVGERISLPYFEGKPPQGDLRGNPHPERYFFNAAVDDARYQWITRQAERLGQAYRATKKPQYARRVVLVLDAFADKYRHYLLHRGRGINNYYTSTGGPCMVDGKLKGKPGVDLPYGWTDSRLGKWWADEIEFALVDAYENVKDSDAWKEFSRQKGYDVRKHVVNDLLRAMVEFIMEIPWDYHFSNNLIIFDRIARVGHIIDEPEFVHIAYHYLSRVIYDYDKNGPHHAGYTFDLHHPEGNQGHYGVANGIWAVYKSIEGYSDPPGFVSKLTGKHLENVSLEKDVPLFEPMVYLPEAYALPDGRLNPLNDSMGWTDLRRNNVVDGRPLLASRCRLLPGLGHAVLGDGRGRQQTQVQLQFSEQGANHRHLDCLSLVWYAHQRELSGDIGYQRNKLRHWASSTLSHNTVVVNSAPQSGGDTFGNVRLYVDDLPGLSVIQVDGTKAYAHEGVSLYRRSVILNTVDPRTPYFIDVFEVEGGCLHDYTMHGSVLGDMVGSCSIPLEPLGVEYPLLEPGEEWQEPRGMGSFNLYGLFRDVAAAPMSQDLTIDMLCEDDPSTGTRIHMPAHAGATIHLGRTPALRKAGHYQDDRVYNWWMPHLIARRRADQSLSSTFVAVYDMFEGGPKVTSVKRLTADGAGVALKVNLGDRTDTILYATDKSHRMMAGSIKMEGRLGVVVREGNKADAYLIGGTSLASGQMRLTSEHPNLTGALLDGRRKYDGADTDAFITDATLPEGKSLSGRWMIVTHRDPVKGTLPTMHAHQIVRIERRDGKTFIHLARDHGLKLTDHGVEELFSKWRAFQGRSTFVIYSQATTVERAVIEPHTGPWDPMNMQRFIPFMREIEVTLGGERRKIRYATGDLEPTADSKLYTKPIVLTESTTVNATVFAPAGVAPPRVTRQAFQRALTPVENDTVTHGLFCKDVHKGKIQGRGTALRFEVGQYDERHFSGLIRAPRDGIYTFYVRASRGCLLTLGEWTVIDSRYFGPYREWSCSVALQQGLHPISLLYYGTGSPFLSVDWSGPGIEKQSIPAEVLYHGKDKDF